MNFLEGSLGKFNIKALGLTRKQSTIEYEEPIVLQQKLFSR